MAATKFRSVDEYIAAQPAPVRPILERVRGAIRRAVPGAEEVISYQIPAFRIRGQAVIYFAAWTRHYSLYPAGGALRAAFADELAPYTIHKATLRFPLSTPVPVPLISRIAKFRALEVAGRATSKTVGTRARRRPSGRMAARETSS